QLTECHDQRSKLEVRSSQLEMKIAALTEHISRRYQTDLATFERDLHGLRVSVREALKRRQRYVSADSATLAEGESQSEAPVAREERLEPEMSSVEEGFAIDWAVVESLVR